MKYAFLVGVALLLALSPVGAYGGTYSTDFSEASIDLLAPGVVTVQGDATASISGGQFSLIDSTGLTLLQRNAFLVPPVGGTFPSGFDLTVVISASTIELMKTCPRAWSGIYLAGVSDSPWVFFGPCGQTPAGFMNYWLIPVAQQPAVASMMIAALRQGGNRIPWSAALPASPSDTTLRVVVDGSTPQRATFYVDGSPVTLRDELGNVIPYLTIGTGPVNRVGVGQWAAHLGLASPAITTTVDSLVLTGDEVPNYQFPPPPPIPGVTAVSYSGLAVLALAMIGLALFFVRGKRQAART